MLAFLAENLGTIVVGLGLLLIVALILRKLVKDRRRGKTACGCGCEGCASRGLCHEEK